MLHVSNGFEFEILIFPHQLIVFPGPLERVSRDLFVALILSLRGYLIVSKTE